MTRNFLFSLIYFNCVFFHFIGISMFKRERFSTKGQGTKWGRERDIKKVEIWDVFLRIRYAFLKKKKKTFLKLGVNKEVVITG